jgi:hypothetical protein
MPRCKAPDISRSEAYMKVRRSDEGRGQRRRWAFFSNLLEAEIAGGAWKGDDIPDVGHSGDELDQPFEAEPETRVRR